MNCISSTSLVCVLILAAPNSRCEPADSKGATERASKQVEDLIRQLGSESFEERERAVQQLTSLGSVALERLRGALKGVDPELTRRAKECIALIERAQRIATLLDQLKHKDPPQRRQAALGLYEIGPPASDAVPVLLKVMLEDPDQATRNVAASALAKLGAEAKGCVPRLLELLNDKKVAESTRESVILVLGGIGGEAGEAVPTLLHILESEAPALKRGAAMAIGKMGQSSKDVITALIGALNDPDGYVQGHAAATLASLNRQPEHCVPALIKLLKRHKRNDRSEDPRCIALRALARFSLDAKSAVPSILEILKDNRESDRVRKAAITALGEFGQVANEAVPTLRTYLNKGDVFDDLAAEALEKIQSNKQ